MSDLDQTSADAGHDDGLELPNGRPRPADVPHHARRTDVDPRAASRAERQVALMFGLSALLTIAALVAYVVVPVDAVVALPMIGDMSASNAAIGLCFGAAILLIGIGAIHWAKKLMNETEVVTARHDLTSEPADREAAISVFEAGAADSGFGSRRLVRRSLIGAMALFPLPMVFMLRDLWVTPTDPATGQPVSPSGELSVTIWREGTRVVTDPALLPIRPEDIPVGGLVNAIPADLPGVEEVEGNLNARAKAAIILVRMDPSEIVSQQGPSDEWSVQGILAFSKICTHLGCPISLYEQRTHHLLCPCHQSTFDLADSANVVFGPAHRRMPQLPITVDDQGYIVARSDFAEPVGPSFWERG